MKEQKDAYYFSERKDQYLWNWCSKGTEISMLLQEQLLYVKEDTEHFLAPNYHIGILFVLLDWKVHIQINRDRIWQ